MVRLGLDKMRHDLFSVLSVGAWHQNVGCPRERGHASLQSQLGLLVVWHVVLVGQVVQLIAVVRGRLLVGIVAGVSGRLVVVLDLCLGRMGRRMVAIRPGGHIQLRWGLHILGLQVEDLLQRTPMFGRGIAVMGLGLVILGFRLVHWLGMMRRRRRLVVAWFWMVNWGRLMVSWFWMVNWSRLMVSWCRMVNRGWLVIGRFRVVNRGWLVISRFWMVNWFNMMDWSWLMINRFRMVNNQFMVNWSRFMVSWLWVMDHMRLWCHIKVTGMVKRGNGDFWWRGVH